MSKKEHISVNLGPFEDAIPLKQHENLKLLEYNNAKQNSKRTLCAGTAL